jgi:hypothetical protein
MQGNSIRLTALALLAGMMIISCVEGVELQGWTKAGYKGKGPFKSNSQLYV